MGDTVRFKNNGAAPHSVEWDTPGAKVVLVRPMAITHQTDTEQNVLGITYFHDHNHPEKLRLTTTYGGHPHSLAQQGYYI